MSAKTGWHTNPMTVFDLESTGIDQREARIVTGYVATVGSRAQRRRIMPGAQVLINPGVPIPKEASFVHGVYDHVAQEKGVDPVDGLHAIAEALYRSLVAGIPIVGFNLKYDFTLLYYECLRHGVPTVAERMGRPPSANVGPIIDAHVLDKHVDSYRKGARNLGATAAHYGVPMGQAHTADADALASARIAVVIAERNPDVAAYPAADLHKLQKLWRADQAASLQRHFRKTRPDAYVDPCWPQCSDPDHPTD